MNLPGAMKLTRDNKSSCEREVMLAPGQSLPRGSSLSRVHVNRPLDKRLEVDKIDGCGWGLCCFTDKTVEVSAESLENWKASLLPVTT